MVSGNFILLARPIVTNSIKRFWLEIARESVLTTVESIQVSKINQINQELKNLRSLTGRNQGAMRTHMPRMDWID